MAKKKIQKIDGLALVKSKSHQNKNFKNSKIFQNRVPDLSTIYLLDQIHDTILKNTKKNLPSTIQPKVLQKIFALSNLKQHIGVLSMEEGFSDFLELKNFLKRLKKMTKFPKKVKF